ncbi:YitT family protein [Priestia koreensis]|uniref:DUF2179 domain-containing protein n=1 Tax=Priestia koreensis TaxID=284581 RepID=A0A0M0KW20_9BACI|nr:YitT family protein [Priestia koreensis]KOO42827.1 hypothetical protein AMD01_16935 [Priestia koreensis]MCM3005421.1 YitT family protein [Priestia koreensis]
MKKNIKEWSILTVGLLLIATYVHFFLAPNQLATGGTSGLSIIIHHYFPGVPVGAIMLGFELVLFVIGFIFLGAAFGTRTVYASLTLSFLVWAFDYLFPMTAPLSDDKLIQLILGISLDALGLALIFKQNASSGGTDIIAMILNKYLSLNMGLAMLAADSLIAASSSLVFGFETGMYAIFGVFFAAIMINFVLKQLQITKQIMIISNHGEEIKRYIVSELKRGATVQTAKGAFTNDSKEVITTVLSRKELLRLKKHLINVDQKAFVTIQDTSEILGNGFARSI